MTSLIKGTKQQLLSIIIPIYNSERFIKHCLDKVLQIKIDKEVIVVNDASSDNSIDILKQYGDRIILIDLKVNGGVSNARNVGIEKAVGKYITFIDADDDFELDMHPKMIKKIIEE
ncbi:MAG: glycosyltransferase, partial [Bacilli bacterium]|nr:glycosyltransferase [Bacilli bacterium]